MATNTVCDYPQDESPRPDATWIVKTMIKTGSEIHVHKSTDVCDTHLAWAFAAHVEDKDVADFFRIEAFPIGS